MDGCTFCGCFKVELEPDYVVDTHLTCDVKPLPMENCHFQEVLNLIEKYRKDYQISIFHFHFWREFANKESAGDPENVSKYLEPVLKTAHLKVSLLVLVMSETDPYSFLEYVSFDNLIITSERNITLTPKVLSCGFLYLNASVNNSEALEQFKGFGLVLQASDENSISFETVDREIELWRSENRTSELQFHGVVQKSDLKTILETYEGKFPGKKFMDDKESFILKMLPLDDWVGYNKSAVFVVELIEHNVVCFVTGGWVKWLNVARLFYPK